MANDNSSSQARSGLRTLHQGEILFHDKDPAHSLFIIQKGQLRLFKPKGKGFIEIGVLQAGEVIGEMAYFDDDGSGRKRSCSAAAITNVEIVEISFLAFGKTIESLNPWFKTIINTLASRLRKTNARLKELEDNQLSLYGKNAGTYEFIKPLEALRILSTIYLVFRSHAEVKGQELVVHRKVLSLYATDVYQIMDAKLETFLNVLQSLNMLSFENDEDKMPNLIHLKNINLIRQFFIFYNTERHLPQEKKMNISDKCEMLISKMLEKLPDNPLVDITNQRASEDHTPKFTKYYNLTPVINELKDRYIHFHADQLSDAKGVGIVGEVVMKDSHLFVEIDLEKMQKLFPVIRFMNSIRKVNQEKAEDH
jgi:CRP/FNR family transcriptional regulator, cyclic AMP receptor protein